MNSEVANVIDASPIAILQWCVDDAGRTDTKLSTIVNIRDMDTARDWIEWRHSSMDIDDIARTGH